MLEPEKIENIKENETGTIVTSSVEALRSTHVDQQTKVDDDDKDKLNDDENPDTKK